MKTSTTFTSTIAPELIAWLDRRARAEKRTRRAMLEEAIQRYRRDIAREHLRKGFEQLARDKNMIGDVLELTEWGMDDYVDLVGQA